MEIQEGSSRDFAAFAEPFCAGWIAHREHADVEATWTDEQFMQTVIDAFEGGGSQQAAKLFGEQVVVVPLSVAENLATLLERVRPIIGSDELHAEVERALAAYRAGPPARGEKAVNERPAKWRGLKIPSVAAQAVHAEWLRRHNVQPDPATCFICWALAQPREETT